MSNERPWLPRTVRFHVMNRDGFTCQYCGATPPEAKMTVDHITPLAAGGTDEPANLITSCHSCNRGKSDTTLEDKDRERLEQREADHQQEIQHEEQQRAHNAAQEANAKSAKEAFHEATGVSLGSADQWRQITAGSTTEAIAALIEQATEMHQDSDQQTNAELAFREIQKRCRA